MTRYFKADFPDGRTALRSTVNRSYAAASVNRSYPNGSVAFHGAGVAIPSGRRAVQCREISADEYRRLTAATRTREFNGLSTEQKRHKLVRAIECAGRDQQSAARCIEWIQRGAMLAGCSERERGQQIARQQRKQANAYVRMQKALGALERSDAIAAQVAA